MAYPITNIYDRLMPTTRIVRLNVDEDPALTELNRTFRQGMQHLFKSETLCDFTIIAGGRQFKIHKAILASVSDVLLAMFTVNMQESQRDTVEFKAISATGMELLLDFVYTGKMALDEDNIDDLVVAATHLQVKAAITECAMFLRETMTTENAIEVYNMAKTFSLPCDLIPNAFEAIVEGFDCLIRDEAHMDLEKTDFEKVLLCDKLNFGPEMELFDSIINWVEHDPETRSQDAPDLICCLRLFHMPPNELESVLAENSYFKENEKCITALEEARNYHRLPIHEKIMTESFKNRVRNEATVMSFGGMKGHHENRHCYALEESDWLQLPDMKHTFRGGAVVLVNNFLIAVGGIVGKTGVTNACHVFDPRDLSWSQMVSMNDKRGHFPMVHVDGYLYVFGGCGERIEAVPHFINTKEIERYSFKENRWERFGSLSNALRKHSACTLDGVIYMSGGIDEMYMSTSRMQSYDPQTQRWTDLAEMNNVRFGHAMVPVENRIYIADPMNRELEYYVPATGQWTRMRITFNQIPDAAQVVHKEQVIYFINGKMEREDNSEMRDRMCVEVCPIRERAGTCVVIARFPEALKDLVCCTLQIPWDIKFGAPTVSVASF